MDTLLSVSTGSGSLEEEYGIDYPCSYKKEEPLSLELGKEVELD